MNRIEAWEQFTQEALKYRTEQIRALHDFLAGRRIELPRTSCWSWMNSFSMLFNCKTSIL